MCIDVKPGEVSPESTAGSSEAKFNRSPFCDSRRGPQIVGGVFELERSKFREETGRLAPSKSVNAFRLKSTTNGQCFRLLYGDVVFLGCGQNNCSLNNQFHGRKRIAGLVYECMNPPIFTFVLREQLSADVSILNAGT